MKRFGFRPFERLRRKKDFDRVFKQGRRRVGRTVVLWTYRRPDTEPGPARLGVIARRRDGNAVRRNLFKRRVREAFRLNKDHLPRGWDGAVMAKSGVERAFPPSHEDIQQDLLDLAGRLD